MFKNISIFRLMITRYPEIMSVHLGRLSLELSKNGQRSLGCSVHLANQVIVNGLLVIELLQLGLQRGLINSLNGVDCRCQVG